VNNPPTPSTHKYRTFSDLSIGQAFHYNGNNYVVVSSRTARLQYYGMRVFYFSPKTIVTPPHDPIIGNNPTTTITFAS